VAFRVVDTRQHVHTCKIGYNKKYTHLERTNLVFMWSEKGSSVTSSSTCNAASAADTQLIAWQHRPCHKYQQGQAQHTTVTPPSGIIAQQWTAWGWSKQQGRFQQQTLQQSHSPAGTAQGLL
jgi:hypothetical protein